MQKTCSYPRRRHRLNPGASPPPPPRAPCRRAGHARYVGADLTEPLSDELEAKIEAAKPTAPRITKEHIQSLIVDETYTNLEGTRTTVCRLQLANGFCVVGVNNGPVSAANFSQEIGCEYAYKAAVDQIWPLEGYLLAERLFAGDVYLEKVGKLRDLVAIQTAPGTVDAGRIHARHGQRPVGGPVRVHRPGAGIRRRRRADAPGARGPRARRAGRQGRRLGAFINGEIYATLDPAERLRLLDQHAAMTEYSNVLGARIAAFCG
jgi:hypothetical protein